MAEQDHAILVGIERYADAAFPPLRGPGRDVELMHAWLTSEAGGRVPAENIRILRSPTPPPAVPPRYTPPTRDEFAYEFDTLMKGPNGRGYPRRAGRLYLYFSGHGFCELQHREPQASLYAANATRTLSLSIDGTAFAHWVREAALFDDVVLIMDCCRDAESAKKALGTGLVDLYNVGSARRVALFCVYAAPKGGKAQERPVAARGGAVHGLLTHAVVEALEHAASDADGRVTSDAVRDYVREHWERLCGGVPADPPEFYLPPQGPMTLVTRPNARRPQPVRVCDWAPDETVVLRDGTLAELARITRSADGRAATVIWTYSSPQTVALDGDRLTLPLGAGLYQLERAGGRGGRIFQAGDADVRL